MVFYVSYGHGTSLLEMGNKNMAAGGFASNREMLNKYVPDVSTPGMEKLMYRGPAVDGRTGDGINMALDANASLSGMRAIAGNRPYLDSEPAIRQFRGPGHMQQALNGNIDDSIKE